MESIGTLASGVAHEINNPINGIMNYAQLIKDGLDPENPLIEYSEEIINETRRVASIVSNLLTFARQETQEYSSAGIADIIESTLSLIRTVIRKDQIDLQVEIPNYLPDIKCRSHQLRQVLMNLLINARDSLNEKYPGYDKNKIIRISSTLLKKKAGGGSRLLLKIKDPALHRKFSSGFLIRFLRQNPEIAEQGWGFP
ncbi:histidine kinase dimerization/phospho-acceptor domain-containing protein [Desulfobacterales bacterium HSG17]|nr:histidine kinase dimerization/phospho-acceptor domain-containing protein [Desulfobacterales bacterium HSG17]